MTDHDTDTALGPNGLPFHLQHVGFPPEIARDHDVCRTAYALATRVDRAHRRWKRVLRDKAQACRLADLTLCREGSLAVHHSWEHKMGLAWSKVMASESAMCRLIIKATYWTPPTGPGNDDPETWRSPALWVLWTLYAVRFGDDHRPELVRVRLKDVRLVDPQRSPE